jgi:hypothetical protein
MTHWATILQNPTFWAIYYYSHIVTKGEEDTYDIIEALFDCELFGLVADETLSIPFPQDYAWHIEFESSTPGIYHTLTHPTFDEPLSLGYDDPHCMLPILRWPEVAPLAQCAQRSNDLELDPHAFTLLFFPLASLTEAEDMAQVRQTLSQAWLGLGLPPADNIPELIKRTVWLSQTMNDDFQFIPVEWHYDNTLGWITNANHSYRNPTNSWSPDDFSRWNTFLDNAC